MPMHWIRTIGPEDLAPVHGCDHEIRIECGSPEWRGEAEMVVGDFLHGGMPGAKQSALQSGIDCGILFRRISSCDRIPR